MGNMQPTEQKQQLQNTQGSQNQQTQNTQTQNLPSWLTDAASANLGFAQNLQGAGFTPYSGQQVAGFSPQQQASFGLGNNLANSVNGGQIGTLVGNAAGAGPSSVNASTIASQMSPYMNQYVSQALAPQLELQNQQFATQNKGFDAQATGAGAFGDTGWGLGRSNLTQQQDTARTGLIGNAYNSAFNTAIGAGAQDVSNKLNAQTTNAGLNETALQRQLQGANQLYGLGSGVANLQNQFGQQQTQQGQAQLNAQYNQWLQAQQYPFQTIQAMNSAIQSGRTGAPISTTGTGSASGNSTGFNFGQSQTDAANNAGYGLLGSLFGAAGTAAKGYLAGGAGGGGAAGAADGGAISGGKPIMVGERGSELFVPGTSGVIIPNEILQAAREKRAKKIGRSAVSGLAQQLGAA